MLHNVKDNYIISVKDHVSQFEEKSFRKLASNDFKSWPSPREETWRLSRLGVLSRKEITPITPNFKKQISSVSKFKGSKITFHHFIKEDGSFSASEIPMMDIFKVQRVPPHDTRSGGMPISIVVDIIKNFYNK